MKDVEGVYAPYREANDTKAASLSNATTPRVAASPAAATTVVSAAVSETRGGGGGGGTLGQGSVPFLGFGEKRPKEVPFLPFGGTGSVSGRDRRTSEGETTVPVLGTIKKVGDDALNPIHAAGGGGDKSAASNRR
jgi:hypothetical protein